MPEISVIVPIYKVEKYLDRCVSSILNQTFTDYELVLVDDGSPDNCGKMCDEYALKDARIRVIHKENGGLADARNAGIEVARGEYFSFIDSDDYVADNFLELLYNALRSHGCLMSICNIEQFFDDGKHKPLYSPYSFETVLYGEEMYDTLILPAAWNKLYHKSLFEEIRYPKGRLFEDCFIYHLILDKLDKLVCVGKNLYYYYIRSDSIMHVDYKLNNTDIVDAVYERATYLDSHGHHKYADEAYLAMYTRLASAYTLLDSKDRAVKERLSELKALFNECYPRIIKDDHFSLKQKAKIWLFRFFPSLHTKLFPMSIK